MAINKEKLNFLPDKSGVYLFKNKEGKIIYNLLANQLIFYFFNSNN